MAEPFWHPLDLTDVACGQRVIALYFEASGLFLTDSFYQANMMDMADRQKIWVTFSRFFGLIALGLMLPLEAVSAHIEESQDPPIMPNIDTNSFASGNTPKEVQPPLARANAMDTEEHAIFEQRCREDDAYACDLLADQFDSDVVDDKIISLQKAVSLYEKACTLGRARACTVLGNHYGSGNAVLPQSKTKAVQYFHKACMGRELTGCNNLGLAYAKGEGVVRNSVQAFTLFQYACSQKLSSACANLGASYSLGDGVKQNKRRAVALFKRTCKEGGLGSCYNLGVHYAKGMGVSKSERRAVSLYEKACAADKAEACNNLSIMVDDGRGVKKDRQRAINLFRKGCALQSAESCFSLGRAYQTGNGIEADYALAVRYLERSLEIDSNSGSSTEARIALPFARTGKDVQP